MKTSTKTVTTVELILAAVALAVPAALAIAVPAAGLPVLALALPVVLAGVLEGHVPTSGRVAA